MPFDLAVQAKMLIPAKTKASAFLASTASFFCHPVLLSLMLLSLCINIHAESWTVLIYMAADNNLAYNARLNLNEMESIAQPAGLKLIVQTDFPGESAKRYRIQQDSDPQNVTSPILKDLGVLDSGDPNTLKDFIRWGQKNYPNQHQMLILWSHADSWYKQKWISPDYESGNAIGVANGELKSALSGMEKLDILLFDACSMQGIEVLMEIGNFADYVIASADLVPDTGFPYPHIIPLLSQNPLAVSSSIPQLYIESYLPGGLHNPSSGNLIATCSTIRTDMLPGFFTRWKSFSNTLRTRADELNIIRENLFEMNTGYADVDIRQFLKRLQAANPPFEGATEMLSYWDAMIVVYGYTLPWLEYDIGTAAIWFPDIRYNYLAAWQHYLKLSFAKTGWLGIVNLALGDDILLPEPPVLINKEMVLNKLVLNLSAPLSPDSLHYYVESTSGSFFVYPEAYADSFTISFFVHEAGEYNIYAIDQSGMKSTALQGSYQLSDLTAGIKIFPNPISNPNSAYLQWFVSNQSDQTCIVELYNLKGQKISKYSEEIIHTEGVFSLNMLPGFAKLSPGIYFITFRLGSNYFVKRMAIMY